MRRATAGSAALVAAAEAAAQSCARRPPRLFPLAALHSGRSRTSSSHPPHLVAAPALRHLRLDAPALRQPPLRTHTTAESTDKYLSAHLYPETHAFAALVALFRRQGHGSAKLDPLGRVERGVWRGERDGLAGASDPAGGSPIMQLTSENNDPAMRRNLRAILTSYEAIPDSSFRHKVLPQLLHLSVLDPHTPMSFPRPHWTPLEKRPWTLVELFQHLCKAYSGTLAAEFTHLRPEQQVWVAGRMENLSLGTLEAEQKKAILQDLVNCSTFEEWLQSSLTSKHKTFGLEGSESFIPGLAALLRRSARMGVKRVEIGMAHRGRLNVLANIMGKDPGLIRAELQNSIPAVHLADVAYHLGIGGVYKFFDRSVDARDADVPLMRKIEMNVAPNPSHLEAINPVVLGIIRAQQTMTGDLQGRETMGVLVHGDGSFAAQGSVMEALQLAGLRGYTTHGTIHIIVNNQIGYTTLPEDARTSLHASDVGKAVNALVLHANAADPEAVHRACVMAADYRTAFAEDVIVDIIGVRSRDHDGAGRQQWGAVQPVTKRALESQACADVTVAYNKQLVEEGVVLQSDCENWRQAALAKLEKHRKAAWAFSSSAAFRKSEAMGVRSWQADALTSLMNREFAANRPHPGLPPHTPGAHQMLTGVPKDLLQHVGTMLCTAHKEKGMVLHPFVERIYAQRLRMVKEEVPVNFAMAEALALGTLLIPRETLDGIVSLADTKKLFRAFSVRLSGQDVERGTFDQRHAVIFDQRTAEKFVPLAQFAGKNQTCEIVNSPLSEMAILGFEYGLSLAMKGRGLVIWEAQFGDFLNGAQTIVDQFIASGEEKWGNQSALVLLLPHGFEGAGPDHSSARIERILSMTNDDPDHLPGQADHVVQEIDALFDSLFIGEREFCTREEFADLLAGIRRDRPELFGSKARGGKAGGAKQAAEGRMDNSAERPGRTSSRQHAQKWTKRSSKVWADDEDEEEELRRPDRPLEDVDYIMREISGDWEGHLTRDEWRRFFLSFIRRNSEAASNLICVQPTTAAQYFHLLRRQANLPYARPLFCFSPKSFMLRHSQTRSPLSELTVGHFFHRVIADHEPGMRKTLPSLVPADQIRRVVICTGKIYFHLAQERKARKAWDVSFVRLEQLAPFPHDRLVSVISACPNAEVVWCQEEPKNAGAWAYVQPRLMTTLSTYWRRKAHAAAADGGGLSFDAANMGQTSVRFVGRPVSSAGGAGHSLAHQQELERVVSACME